MSKEQYQRNRTRVFEICGIASRDKRYNCHHIVGREEYRLNKEFWDNGSPGGHFDLDGKGNVFPVTLEQHAWINQRIGHNQPTRVERKKRRRRTRR
jgi:hypothetical protein